MSGLTIAVLGGDRREVYMADQLAKEGHEVRLFACSPLENSQLRNVATAADAVRGAQWLVCPSPGLGAGDMVYAPGSTSEVALDAGLLQESNAQQGGLVLGKATPTVQELADELGVAVFEMKEEAALAISNATSVAEAVVQLLVDLTDRILREHTFTVIGYGATGAAITDYLLAACCTVTVTARSPRDRARAVQRGASAVPYEDRSEALSSSDIAINTVPDADAVPQECFGGLRARAIVDIASPPGGLDHEKAIELGLPVTWARGLAGARAPESVGDAQLAFVRRAMAATDHSSSTQRRKP